MEYSSSQDASPLRQLTCHMGMTMSSEYKYTAHSAIPSAYKKWKEKPRCNGASQTPPCHPWWRTRLVAAPVNQSINQSRFFSGLSNLNHCEVHYSARRKDCCSRNVFKWRLNDCNLEAETVCSGRGTTRRLVPAERRALRSGTSTVEVSGPRYRGALLWRTLYVSTAILNWIRCSTRSQCKLTVVWENHRRPQETTGDPNRPQES